MTEPKVPTVLEEVDVLRGILEANLQPLEVAEVEGLLVQVVSIEHAKLLRTLALVAEEVGKAHGAADCMLRAALDVYGARLLLEAEGIEKSMLFTRAVPEHIAELHAKVMAGVKGASS